MFQDCLLTEEHRRIQVSFHEVLTSNSALHFNRGFCPSVTRLTNIATQETIGRSTGHTWIDIRMLQRLSFSSKLVVDSEQFQFQRLAVRLALLVDRVMRRTIYECALESSSLIYHISIIYINISSSLDFKLKCG